MVRSVSVCGSEGWEENFPAWLELPKIEWSMAA